MGNREFFRTSEIEVKKLNGSISEDVQEAWRAGYLFAHSIVKNAFEAEYNSDFMEAIENFINEDLEIFSTPGTKRYF